MRRIGALVAGLLLPASIASAASLSLSLSANNVLPTAGPIIVSVNAVGGEPIAGADLFLFVGDGGPNFGGVTPRDTSPAITGGSMTEPGMVFGSNNTGTTYLNLDLGDPGGTEPLAAVMNTTTTTGTVAAAGLLGTFTLDISGKAEGTYSLHLDPDNTFVGGVPASSLEGATLTIIPEPASALLLIGTLPFLRRRSA